MGYYKSFLKFIESFNKLDYSYYKTEKYLNKKMLKIYISLLSLSMLFTSCVSDVKDENYVYSYGTKGFTKKVQEANISLEDAVDIICKYKVENKVDDYNRLYFISGDNYVFKNSGFSKGVDAWLVRGTDGIYVNMNSGNLKTVAKDDGNSSQMLVKIKRYNFILFSDCNSSVKITEYRSKLIQ